MIFCRDSSSRRSTKEHNSWFKDNKFGQAASVLRQVLYSAFSNSGIKATLLVLFLNGLG